MNGELRIQGHKDPVVHRRRYNTGDTFCGLRFSYRENRAYEVEWSVDMGPTNCLACLGWRDDA